MRYMVIVKASPESEAGVMPDEQLLAEMAAYPQPARREPGLRDGA